MDHCEMCGAPDDGTQTYCACGAQLVDILPRDVMPPGAADRIRTVRRGLVALDETGLACAELTAVLDAWDAFEQAQGTADGGAREVMG